MSNTAADLLVLGLGNLLLGDDGIGPAAVARLRDSYDIPDGVRCLDGGTLGLSLLPYIEDARAVILVDAILQNASPGSLVRITGEDVGPAVATRLSPHQVGVADLLQGARWHDREPAKLVLLGIVPESIELGVGLSPPVLRALPELIEAVCNEATSCGFAFAPQATSGSGTSFEITQLLSGTPS